MEVDFPDIQVDYPVDTLVDCPVVSQEDTLVDFQIVTQVDTPVV